MAYIGKSPSKGVRNRFQYQATAGQQTFSNADANGLTLTYTDSLYMDVYQNGILLVPGDDYTATTGTTVVLVQAASVDDIVEMVVYDVFSVNDSVSASSGGTFSGNVVMGGNLTVSGAFTSQGIDDNADATAITIDSSENVGIGTSSPSAKLTIEGGTAFTTLELASTSGSATSAFMGVTSGSDLAVKVNGAERMRIDSSGNAGFGLTSPTFASGNGFHLADNFYHGYGNGNGTRPDFQVGQDSGTNTLAFRCGTGADTIDLSLNTSGVFSGDFNDTSDERLKENIQNIADNQINIVKQLRPVTFDWKEGNKGSDTGFIAQEVKLLLPNDVHTVTGQDDDSHLGINSLGLIATLTKALQEAITKIEALESKVTALENAE